MKFCSKCGKELDDEAVVCVGCGCAVANVKSLIKPTNVATKFSSCAITGFVLSLVSAFFLIISFVGVGVFLYLTMGLSIAGLICSCIGYKKCKNEVLCGSGMGLTGIILSAITLGISVIIFIIAIIAYIQLLNYYI